MNLRAAIYTRKSVANAFDVQRAVGEAFAVSQGWTCLSNCYDDDDFGVCLERPALQQLRADMRADKLDAVVVYDITRLSRLPEHIVELLLDFLEHGCAFATVAQPYNSTTLEGRNALIFMLKRLMAGGER